LRWHSILDLGEIFGQLFKATFICSETASETRASSAYTRKYLCNLKSGRRTSNSEYLRLGEACPSSEQVADDFPVQGRRSQHQDHHLRSCWKTRQCKLKSIGKDKFSKIQKAYLANRCCEQPCRKTLGAKQALPTALQVAATPIPQHVSNATRAT
jgi:hypothetical protein